MSDTLLISVRFHEGWYHGSGGPPSPARMYQALVAGVGNSGPLDEGTVEALIWLEKQDPPIVGLPYTTSQKSYVNYVPNNEADAYNGYQEHIKKAEKRIAPLLFDPAVPFLFAWRVTVDAAIEAAKMVLPLADRVYQLGRCIDMAWAWAEILTADELRERLSEYPGLIRHPSAGVGNIDCPTVGSLESLQRRFDAGAHQFAKTTDGKSQTFRRRPKPKWKKVSYEGVGSQLLLELRRSDDSGFLSWPLERASELVVRLRDEGANKLRETLTHQLAEIDRTLIGRKPNGENDGPSSARVKIIPLPSIGHQQADMQIRRVLVEIPGDCPLRSDDIAWALSGVRLAHPVLGERLDVIASGEEGQLKFYGIKESSRIWRSVTPVVLPDAARRRIAPHRKKGDTKETKGGHEKYTEHCRAAFAVTQALRHVGVSAKVNSIRVQREPFDLRGTRVEPFADGTRFSKHSLWHLGIEFDSLVSGPLLLGNGRFLGLGLMKPVRSTNGIFAFSIESGLTANPNPIQLARALRRAIIARTRDVLGTSRIPSFVSGHREDGSPARSEEQPHLAFIFDPVEKQLLVITPPILTKQGRWQNEKYLPALESALQDFRELRAGSAGLLEIRRTFLDRERHHLLRASNIWESVTPYHVNRHARRSTAETVLKNNLIAECEKSGLQLPHVSVLEWKAVKRVGLQGHFRLTFKNSVEGPIVLGKTRHVGGGVFSSMTE